MSSAPASTATVTVTVIKLWPICDERAACTGRDIDDAAYLFYLQKRHGAPAPGEVWEFSGATRLSPYGLQMVVRSAKCKRSDGRLIVGFLARSEVFRSARIGRARAAALWEAFGSRLYRILDDGDVEELKKVARFPADSIAPLIAAWRTVKAEGGVVRWLADKGFPLWLARKVIDIYGATAIEKLEDNPYRLLAFCSFAECEMAGKKMGIVSGDPRRLRAAAQEACYRELAGGHTVSPREILLARICELVIDPVLATRSLRYGLETNALIETEDGISTRGIRALEDDAMRLLRSFLARSGPDDLVLPEMDPQRVDDAIALFEREAGYKLNEAQRCAIGSAFTNRVSVLCGGAGTGKTTVLRAIATAMSGGIYFMALSGQAARRMSEATGRKATTIEYFLRRVVPELKSLAGAFIVVDESSMLDLATAVRLLRVLHPSCRLLFLGDPHQLPPVGFGLIFHRLAEDKTIPRVELILVKRQSAESGIPSVSELIRTGIVPALTSRVQRKTDVWFEMCPRHQVIDRLFALREALPDSVILCPKNSGGLGVDDVNEAFHREFHGSDDAIPTHAISVGEPVIFKRNVASLDLVNGSFGRAVRLFNDEDEGWSLECDFDNRRVVVSGDNLEWVKLAHALTVHSAQGSQFTHVIVVSEQSRVLDRTWVYTAITRAVKRAVLVGDHDSFARAVIAPPLATCRRVAFRASITPPLNHA